MGECRNRPPSLGELEVVGSNRLEKTLADAVLRFPRVFALILEPHRNPLSRSLIVEAKRGQKIARFQKSANEDIVAVECIRLQNSPQPNEQSQRAKGKHAACGRLGRHAFVEIFPTFAEQLSLHLCDGDRNHRPQVLECHIPIVDRAFACPARGSDLKRRAARD